MALNKHVVNAGTKETATVPLTSQEEADKLAADQAYIDATPAREEAEKDSKADLTDDVLKAFALVVLDEINTLRSQHALSAITPAQLKAAVKAKL